MELEPISDISQRSRGFHTVRSGDDRGEVSFIPRFVYLLDIDYRTTSGPVMGPYRPRVELPP